MYNDAEGLPLKFDQFYHKLKMDLSAIKQLGFNTVRFPQEPPHPFCADLADSLGLFILVENGIWRLPSSDLVEDYLIQASWALADEIMLTFQQHPCLLALGIGQEIPVQTAEASKYLNYLNDYLDQHGKIMRYISPFDYHHLPSEARVDFYLINSYDQAIFNLLNSSRDINQLTAGGIPVVLGTVGFPRIRIILNRMSTRSAGFSGFLNYTRLNQTWPALSGKVTRTGGPQYRFP
jgi:hypothetical protein